MKKTTSFGKVVLCHTNDFKNNINNKIKTWVEANGGTFEKELNSQVTHLVTSKKAWKRLHPIVRQARRMRTVHIVKYDWLEDSLMKKPIRALAVDKYLYEQTSLKYIKKAKKQFLVKETKRASKEIVVPRDKRIELAGIEFDRARQEFEEDMGTAGFHPYSDKTGFVYVVTLLRYDVLKTRFEKHRLKVGHNPPTLPHDIIPGFYVPLHLFPAPEPFSSFPVIRIKLPASIKSSSCLHLAEPWAQCVQLYESDIIPHTYACYTQYTRPGTSKQLLTLAPPGSTWDFTWQMFEKYFKQKVGSSWNNRSNNGTEMNLGGEDKGYRFQYQSPKLGEPGGLRKFERSDEEGSVDGGTRVATASDSFPSIGHIDAEPEAYGDAPEARNFEVDDSHFP